MPYRWWQLSTWIEVWLPCNWYLVNARNHFINLCSHRVEPYDFSVYGYVHSDGLKKHFFSIFAKCSDGLRFLQKLIKQLILFHHRPPLMSRFWSESFNISAIILFRTVIFSPSPFFAMFWSVSNFWITPYNCESTSLSKNHKHTKANPKENQWVDWEWWGWYWYWCWIDGWLRQRIWKDVFVIPPTVETKEPHLTTTLQNRQKSRSQRGSFNYPLSPT